MKLFSLVFLLCPLAHAQTDDLIARPDYRNTVYDPSPVIPGATVVQPTSVAVYNGNAGAPGDPRTPNDGQIFLVRSVIGQAVGGLSARIPGEKIYKVGEEFAPAVALGVNGTVAPASIDPPYAARFVPGLDRVVAAFSGFVQIEWIRNDGTTNSPVRYYIEQAPFRDPVGLYHTHASDGDLSNNVGRLTWVPKVEIPNGLQVELLHHPGLPDTIAIQFEPISREMRTKNNLGFIVLIFRNASADYLDREVVDVRANVPGGSATLADIGHLLAPYVVKPNPAKPHVSHGIGPNRMDGFAYQHNDAASPQNGEIFAIRRTDDDLNIQVYWTRYGVQQVVWPYELHRYTANWPAQSAKYQHYVRGSTAVKGPDVEVPTSLNAMIMPFQEPLGHANEILGNRFLTTDTGWSLLKYAPSNAVIFQVVRSVPHNDPTLYDLTSRDWEIGIEITEPAHQGPRVGYIHYPEGDRYDWETYQGTQDNPIGWQAAWTTGQIFPINTGPLEVWWSNLRHTVQWPSFVKRYNAVWPADPERIIIASQKGTGPVDTATQVDFRIYFQNSPTFAGFNPNDEHAFVHTALGERAGGPRAIFALRDDLDTPLTSDPFVLMKYRNPADTYRWRFRLFRVFAEGLGSDGQNYVFNYPATAGVLIQLPYPVSYLEFLQPCVENTGVSGPYWRDRNEFYWARAAGDSGGQAEIIMRYFYSTNTFADTYPFYFPTSKPPVPGAHVAWLDRRPGGSPGVPTDIKHTVTWPPNLPELRVGETLVGLKAGLPSIRYQSSVEIIYQQSVANHIGDSVVLIDPTVERSVALAQLPSDLPSEAQSGNYYFTTLPPHLRTRLWWDPVGQRLKFNGQFIEPIAGEYYLLPNVITGRERQLLLRSSSDSRFVSALGSLCNLAASATPVPPNTPFDSLALTAGLGKGTGYVTVAFGNSTNLSPEAEPIVLAVIKVTCPIYRGELKVIASDNPFDEKLTLRHSGDFAGKADEYQFEWRTLPPENGGPSPLPPTQWARFGSDPLAGEGALDITIQGPGIYTLSDNYFVCRYKPLNPSNPCGTNDWSDWTFPMLAEGWIKRVLAGINPFDQRFKRYDNHQVNTIISMISQAGPRPVGATPLNAAGAENFGLLEIYGTVLDRGRSLSIEGSPALDYGPANDSLLLVASRISKMYMLLGNEAYADATDPTIAYGTASGEYGTQASSIHCFQNQLPTLLDEEMALLRGRDDTQLPSVQTPPFYNKLIWNFTQGDGEVAYQANYGIHDANASGGIDEADGKILYPQGHGDAWGHYLTAIKSYYRLLRNGNFTWIPRSEAVLVGGVPVSVDYQDERQFASAAAARAKTGAEIVNLTYRAAYVEDPAGQWQGYQDANTNRAWGLSEWASRAGQGAYFDWVVGNALLPSGYQQSYQITDDTLAHTQTNATYHLTDDVIVGSIASEASRMSSHQVAALLSMPRIYNDRQTLLEALDAALGVAERLRFQSIILRNAQLSGLPEFAFSILEILKGNQYPTLESLETALKSSVGTNTFDTFYQLGIKPYLAYPAGEPPTGIRRIERATVPELRELSAAFYNIQDQLDQADAGLNPLGLAKNALPFDINPRDIDEGTTHFEQIYQRAVRAMNNAIAVFNYANNASQNLRKQADSAQEFRRNVFDREADFNSRLIEIFGYPYSDDIGPTGSYRSGYNGPDLYHYMYIDSSRLLGIATPATHEFTVPIREFVVSDEGGLSYSNFVVKFHVAPNGFGFVKPAGWIGQRRAPGEIQLAHLDLLQAKARFERANLEYENLISQIEDQADLLQAQYSLNASEITILNAGQSTQESLNTSIARSRERQLNFQTKARLATLAANALAEGFPKFFGIIAGMAGGTVADWTFAARAAVLLAGNVVTEIMTQNANRESLVELDHQQAKELSQSQQNIKLTVLRQDQAILQQIAQLEQLVRQEAPLRLEIYNLQEALQQSAGRYSSALARGQRILEDRLRFRQQTAEKIQGYRYNDMAFRIFRNEALQKYRAQFDQAAQYVYLAAKAYDFDSNLRPSDPALPGSFFLNRIVRARTIGVISQNGEPQTGSLGDPGLADPMAVMKNNFIVLKDQLGFNSAQPIVKEFSLRSQFLRILPGAEGNASWRSELTKFKVPNLLDIPEFRRHCLFQPSKPREPGIVISVLEPFLSTTIDQDLNFFGWPADVAGDSSFNPTEFSTKIRSVRVSFSNYRISGAGGMREDPRVYLVPVGTDILRSPRITGQDNINFTREWKIQDQWLPVPFPIADKNDPTIALPNWMPFFSVEVLQGFSLPQMAEVRAHPSFDALHDAVPAGNRDDPQYLSARLIGRSVWNTRWLLVIPAVNLLADEARTEGLERFINGGLNQTTGQRDGGVTDIKIRFKAYAYSGR